MSASNAGASSVSSWVGDTDHVLGQADLILADFLSGISVENLAIIRGIPVSAVEWWLRIAASPPPFRGPAHEDRHVMGWGERFDRSNPHHQPKVVAIKKDTAP